MHQVILKHVGFFFFLSLYSTWTSNHKLWQGGRSIVKQFEETSSLSSSQFLQSVPFIWTGQGHSGLKSKRRCLTQGKLNRFETIIFIFQVNRNNACKVDSSRVTIEFCIQDCSLWSCGFSNSIMRWICAFRGHYLNEGVRFSEAVGVRMQELRYLLFTDPNSNPNPNFSCFMSWHLLVFTSQSTFTPCHTKDIFRNIHRLHFIHQHFSVHAYKHILFCLLYQRLI